MKSVSKLIFVLCTCTFLSGCGVSRTETDNPVGRALDVLTVDGKYESVDLSNPFEMDKLEARQTTYDKVHVLFEGVANSPMFVAVGDGETYTIYGAHPKGTTAHNTISHKALMSKDILLEVHGGKLVYTYDLCEYEDDTVFTIKIVKDKNLTVIGFMLTQAEKEEV